MKQNVEKSNLFYINNLKQVQLPDSLENTEDIKQIRRIQDICLLINDETESLLSNTLDDDNASTYKVFFEELLKISIQSQNLNSEMIDFFGKYGNTVVTNISIHQASVQSNEAINSLLADCTRKLDVIRGKNISLEDKDKQLAKLLNKVIKDKTFKEFFFVSQEYRNQVLSLCYQVLLTKKHNTNFVY